MTTRLKRGEWTVEGESVEDLMIGVQAINVAIQQEGTGTTLPAKTNTTVPSDSGTTLQSIPEKDRSGALKFLKAVRASGANGITAEDLVMQTGVKSSQAVGALVKYANKVSKALAIQPELVFEANKSGNSPKLWSTAPKMNAVIEALEEMER